MENLETATIEVERCSPGMEEFQLSPSPSEKGDSQEKKYYCQRCLNHNQFFPRKGHKPFCQYNACNCSKCKMVETRRLLNNALVRKGSPIVKPAQGQRRIRDPMCARCKAHNERVPLRGHKKSMCRYATCVCATCQLVEERRSLMARQIKLRRDQLKQRDYNNQHADHLSLSPGSETGQVPSTPPMLLRETTSSAESSPIAVNSSVDPPRPQIAMPTPLYPPFMYPNLNIASLLAAQAALANPVTTPVYPLPLLPWPQVTLPEFPPIDGETLMSIIRKLTAPKQD